LDGSILIDATQDEKFRHLEARFNAYDIPINTIPDGLSAAQDILSPYLERDEIKALGFLLSVQMPKHFNKNEVNYTKTFGSYTISVEGRMDTGEMSVRCFNEDNEVSQ
jgi:hypothetical protein